MLRDSYISSMDSMANSTVSTKFENKNSHWKLNSYEWIKKVMGCKYSGILLGHKKEWIWVGSSEVDEPRAYYTEWSHKERNKYHLLVHMHGI